MEIKNEGETKSHPNQFKLKRAPTNSSTPMSL